jgi:hypothetical protein
VNCENSSTLCFSPSSFFSSLSSTPSLPQLSIQC